MRLDSMKLSTKLIAAFIAVCMIGAVISAIGIRSLASLDAEAGRLYSQEVLGLSYSKEANINLIYIGRAMRNAMLATTPERRDQSLLDVDKNMKLMQENLDKARPLYYSDKGRALVADLDTMLVDYRRVLQELRTKVLESQPDDRLAMSAFMFDVFGPVVGRVDDQLTALADVKADNAKATSDRASEVFRSSRDLMLGLLAGGVLLGVGLGMWMTRHLTRQLGTEPGIATALAHSVANGDLSVHIALRPGDKHSLMASLKAMRDSLLQVVSNVRQNADGVATASSQIAQGNLDLSSRTEQQASALQQTAASMEELTSTVKQNADNARQANQLAMNASTVAVQGGDVVGEVVQTMKGINDSSKRIADIIGVIDGIAFQTNILALNAAVEAARAGEQGRGFAVVASEVRSLAQRSAEAAKEIKTLISASVERVDQGSALVDRAGTTMQEVVASIRRVTDIMGEISAASVEQSSGVSQIGEAVTQMDRVTQQNAALVEESAAAAESLKSQARKLVEVVAVFKLDNQPTFAAG